MKFADIAENTRFVAHQFSFFLATDNLCTQTAGGKWITEHSRTAISLASLAIIDDIISAGSA
jgi:hypothetical protein